MSPTLQQSQWGSSSSPPSPGCSTATVRPFPSHPVLSQITQTPSFAARYAGPIKTTTRWTIGAEVELPASSTFKSKSLPDETTSAANGRSAHVFSSFPTLTSNGFETQGGSTSGEGSSDAELEGTLSLGLHARSRGRQEDSAEAGARAREISAGGRPRPGSGGGSPGATTP